MISGVDSPLMLDMFIYSQREPPYQLLVADGGQCCVGSIQLCVMHIEPSRKIPLGLLDFVLPY